MITPLLAIALVLTAFLIAFAVLMVMGHLDGRRVSALRRLSAAERGSIAFLFDNESLSDATPAARDLLATGPKRGSDWSRLAYLLEPRFPHLNDWIAELAELGEMERISKDGTSQLQAEWHDGVARVTLRSTGVVDPGQAPDKHALAAMMRELETLRAATEHTPYPIWQEEGDGAISWCNRTYLDLLDALDGSDEGDTVAWPPRRLFELAPPTGADDTDGDRTRAALTPEGEDKRYWFEIDRRPFGTGYHCTAIPVDELVKAQASLSEFVTTLTKTFATLPIGLAIFNRERELAMFNPALLDLTTLPVDFLCAKPTLSSFLDRLRTLNMMPEPKDYKSWRKRVADLVTQAQNGTYEENWTLSGGQTYRVTGRPHPDGAVAILFEDISTEVSHARRFRAEIETGQAALDAMPGGLAIFSTAGILTLTNRAYADLWGYEPTGTIGETSIFDALKRWRDACAPTGVWDDIRAFVGHAGARQGWSAQVTLVDGRPMEARVLPLPNGVTMVEFSLLTTLASAPQTQPHADAGETAPEEIERRVLSG